MSDEPRDDAAPARNDEGDALLRELVDAERRRPALPAERERAVRERVERATSPASDAPVEPRGAAQGPGPATAPRGPEGALRARWFALGACFGGALVAAALSLRGPRVVVSQTVVLREVVARDAAAATDEPATPATSSATAPVEAGDALVARESARGRATTHAARAPVDDGERASTTAPLERERLLLEAARSAVARGAWPEALAAVAAHERAHRRGQLAEERDALRVEALAGAGEREEAWARAQVFFARYSQSPSRGAVERALREHPRAPAATGAAEPPPTQ